MHLVLKRRLVVAVLALASCTGALPTTQVVSKWHLRHGSIALLASRSEPAAQAEAGSTEEVADTEAVSSGSSDAALQEAEEIATEVEDPNAAARSHTTSNLPQPAASAAEPQEAPTPTSATAGLHEDPANADVIEETERLAAQAEAEASSDSGSDDSEAAAAAALNSAGLAEADLDGINSASAPSKAAPTNVRSKPPPTAQPSMVSPSAVPHTVSGHAQVLKPMAAVTAAPPASEEKVRAAARAMPVANSKGGASEPTAAHPAQLPANPASLGVAPVMATARVKHRMLRADPLQEDKKAKEAKKDEKESQKSGDVQEESPKGRDESKAKEDEKDKEEKELDEPSGKAKPVPPGIASHPGEPLEEEVDEEMSAADEEQEEKEEDEMLEAEKLETKSQEDEEKEEERKLAEEEEELQQREQRYASEEAAQAKQRKQKHNARGLAEAREDRERHEMDRLEERIAKETNSSALAEMLSLIKLDAYQLNDKVDILHKEIEDGVELAPEDPSDSLIYPLSTCMRCCIMVAVQYFFVYTAMAVCKAFTSLFALGEATKTELALSAACDTVYYAPMLCVLFLGAQLRALQITAGKGGPQDWAEMAMEASVWSLLVQTIIVLATNLITGGEQYKDSPRSDNVALVGLFELLRYVSLIGLYVGFTVVCIAVLLMDARSLGAKPIDLWDNPTTVETEYSPPVSAAMACIMTLTVFFFMIHLAHAVLWSCVGLAGGQTPRAGGGFHAFVVSAEQCLRLCMSAVDLAPILCALLIAVRMRALQFDPKYGRPQSWSEGCFYVIVGSLLAQPVLIVLMAMTGSMPEVDLVCRTNSPLVKRIFMVSNYVNMSVMYVACFAVGLSAFFIQAKGKPTPPVSPTMFCVIMLAILHLSTYSCLLVSQMLGRAQQTCKMAEQAVKLGPMLAVLFLGTRMRALQLSKQEGSPQCWAQDAMYTSVGAVLAELCVVAAVGIFMTDTSEDAKGQVAKSIRQTPQRILVQLLQALFFLLLHGGVILVVASTLTVRPETAACADRGFPGLRGL